MVLGFVLVMLLLGSLNKRQLALPSGFQMQALPAGGSGPMSLSAPRPALAALEARSDPHEDRVLKLADTNPRAVADVVQTWMREEDQ